MRRIRTIVIDDSAFMRKVISDLIAVDSTIELAGVATGGEQGLRMALELKPDVVITDMVMPDHDGLYVVNELMDRHPVPIILLSSLEKSDARIFDALQSGAFEFIDKPTERERNDKQYKLVDLIKQASQTDISLLKARQLAKRNANTHSFDQTLNYEIVVIGASTGGPGAVELVLTNLPPNLSIPVVVVQHMPQRFLETFAVRLNEQGPLPVKIPTKGEPLKGGVVYVAPGDTNLRIDRNMHTGSTFFNFTDKKYTEFNHPSIDCLFESVAQTYGKNSIGVILTGMGRDGASGLGRIHEKGGFTIAQDEQSSVVYGMPKAAFESGAAQRAVPLKQIAGFIISCL